MLQSEEEPVLVEGVVNDGFSELNKGLIRNYQSRNLWILEGSCFKAGQVSQSIGEYLVAHHLVVDDLVPPALLETDAVQDGDDALFLGTRPLLVDPVLVVPALAAIGRSQPQMGQTYNYWILA